MSSKFAARMDGVLALNIGNNSQTSSCDALLRSTMVPEREPSIDYVLFNGPGSGSMLASQNFLRHFLLGKLQRAQTS